jgi:hypothetical protein
VRGGFPAPFRDAILPGPGSRGRLVHLLYDAQRALIAFASPAVVEPARDFVTYWHDFPLLTAATRPRHEPRAEHRGGVPQTRSARRLAPSPFAWPTHEFAWSASEMRGSTPWNWVWNP